MPELQEALRAYGERLVELVDAGATAAAEPRGWRGRRRVVLVGACIAILGAGAALVAWRDEPAKVQPPAGEETPAEPTDDALAGAWTALPTRLGNGDSQPALLVTNEGLINLHSENGGNDVAGEIWAVGADRTTPFAPSGLVWRAFPSVAWTGTELVMTGGANGPGVTPLAAAYDPVTDQWRELPDPPGIATGQSANEMTDGVWTGSELISWNSALAYAPASESWRSIEPSPLSERSWAAVAATDNGVFVWGGCSPLPTSQCDEVSGEDELTDGALYDPQTDSWQRVAPSPLGPGDHPTAVWTGQEVIVNVPAPVDPNAPNMAAYDPTTDSWRALPDSPHPAGRYTKAVWTGRFLVLHGGVSGDGTPSGATSLLDLEREQWYRLPDGPPRGPHSIVAIDPTSVVIAGGYSDASPWLLEFVEPTTEPSTATAPVDVPPRVGRIDGRLLDGRTFSVRHDPAHGLCVVLDTEAEGCDDEGPVLSPTADPATARFSGFNSPPYEQNLRQRQRRRVTCSISPRLTNCSSEPSQDAGIAAGVHHLVSGAG